MKKSHVAVLLAIVVAVAVAMPSFGATSIGRVNARVSRIVDLLREVRIDARRERTFQVQTNAFSDGNGFAEGTADCPEDAEITGGGAEWADGATNRFDRIRSSTPDGNGWYVAADSNRPAGSKLTIFAVCAFIGPRD
jgi:hypothetical protein